MKVVMYWKLLALVLITVYLFGCRDNYGYNIGNGSSTIDENILGTTDVDTIMQEESDDGEPIQAEEHTMTTEVNVPELDLEDIEAILPTDIEVPVPVDKPTARKVDVPELDLEDIEAILPTNIEVPVPKPPVEEQRRDSKPPKITDSSIEDNAKEVGRASIIRITFNEPIADGELTLRTEEGDIVETRVNFGTENIHLERLGKNIVLLPLTTYVIEGTVSDAAGNETEVELTFTTGEENF